jgi:geranylgeranyl diphosphate synthase type II
MNESRATTTPEARLVREVLDEYGGRVRARLVEFLDRWEYDENLYPLVRDYPLRGGRMLRPSLCIASARAFGASVEDALDTAVGLELMHNAFLIHDDVEDDGEERRGGPTMHTLHGAPIAINAGDALAVLSMQPLLENRERLGPRVTLRVLEEANRMARESVEGQAMELAWRRENRIDLRDGDYLQMVLKKTCWYTTIYPIRAGALIGTRDGVDLDRFLRFGFFVGAAFQITDDLLNLVGDADRYGKELNGDIWEGKRTLMMTSLFARASEPELARLRACLSVSRHARGAQDVRWLRDRMDAYGCVEHAQRVAHGLAGAGLHELSSTFRGCPPSRDLQFIEGLAKWMIQRA